MKILWLLFPAIYVMNCLLIMESIKNVVYKAFKVVKQNISENDNAPGKFHTKSEDDSSNIAKWTS